MTDLFYNKTLLKGLLHFANCFITRSCYFEQRSSYLMIALIRFSLKGLPLTSFRFLIPTFCGFIEEKKSFHFPSKEMIVDEHVKETPSSSFFQYPASLKGSIKFNLVELVVTLQGGLHRDDE